VFYFQDENKDNGIHVPFTIRIQTPFQLQTMVSLSDNGAISMDTTFNTNDVKFHLFTLTVFDAHRIGMPVAWIIISCQACTDLVEWLTLLKKQNFQRRTLSGNLHVLSLMMLHKSYKHYGELYFHSTFFSTFMYMQPFQNFIPHSPL